MATKRVYFLAHGGTVQGVGYRYFTRKHAAAHELTGWVRNLPNNKVPLPNITGGYTEHALTMQVEGEVQGDADAVAKLLQLLDRGPSAARVVRLDQEDREVVATDVEFEIRR